MIIKPIEFTLKNGIKGIIRTPVVEDAEAMLDLMSTVGQIKVETIFLTHLLRQLGNLTTLQDRKLY